MDGWQSHKKHLHRSSDVSSSRRRRRQILIKKFEQTNLKYFERGNSAKRQLLRDFVFAFSLFPLFYFLKNLSAEHWYSQKSTTEWSNLNAFLYKAIIIFYLSHFLYWKHSYKIFILHFLNDRKRQRHKNSNEIILNFSL